MRNKEIAKIFFEMSHMLELSEKNRRTGKIIEYEKLKGKFPEGLLEMRQVVG